MSMVNDGGIRSSHSWVLAGSFVPRKDIPKDPKDQASADWLFDCGPRSGNWFVLTAGLKVMNLCLAA